MQKQPIIPRRFEFSGVKGIRNAKISLDSKSKMHVFIGNNGVGKTKTLECLYQALLLSSSSYCVDYSCNLSDRLVFQKAILDGQDSFGGHDIHSTDTVVKLHDLPVVYVPAFQRGIITSNSTSDSVPLFPPYAERKREYFDDIMANMGGRVVQPLTIAEWIIQRALSASRYQENANNREVELLTLLRVLHKIDARISDSPESLSLPGGNKVLLTIDGEKRELSELSSGFASLVKIVQTIVSAYSFFTNSNHIEDEAGIVLIDEIESHLHISWQTRILPILEKTFPNTIFIVATHSSLVLSQLYTGKAYQLVKENHSVVNKEIRNPSNQSLIDLLTEAFQVDINRTNLENISPERQRHQKQQLKDILNLED